ncbi:MAG: GNAT family N-acetyltransferase [Candidatus Thorarchaeota archaeon]|jgi:hypothetical protein
MLEMLPVDNIDKLDDILGRFVESQPSSSTLDALKEQLSKGLTEGTVEVFTEVENSEVAGVVVIGLKNNRVGLLFADNSVQLETRIFDFAYDRLKSKGGIIRMGGSWLSEVLIDHAVSRGFARFDRFGMTVERDTLEAVSRPDIPNGYALIEYISDMREEIACLIHRSHRDGIDVGVFPEYFGAFEACQQLLEDTENSRFGQFSPHSKVLKHDGRNVGAIVLSIVRENRGYIPDVCIDPEYRRNQPRCHHRQSRQEAIRVIGIRE